MVRIATERVTVRLNKQHLNTIDALIQMGQLRNRTQAVAEAVRDYVNTKTIGAKQLQEQAKNQLDIQNIAATMQQMQAQLAKLQRK